MHCMMLRGHRPNAQYSTLKDMSSEAMMQRAKAINDVCSLITKLGNLESAIGDFGRLRLAGAQFYGCDDESFQEYFADIDSIRTLACGRAGDAIREELVDQEALDHLCNLCDDDGKGDLGPNDLRIIAEALERAQARAQVRLQKLLAGDED